MTYITCISSIFYLFYLRLFFFLYAVVTLYHFNQGYLICLGGKLWYQLWGMDLWGYPLPLVEIVFCNCVWLIIVVLIAFFIIYWWIVSRSKPLIWLVLLRSDSRVYGCGMFQGLMCVWCSIICPHCSRSKGLTSEHAIKLDC